MTRADLRRSWDACLTLCGCLTVVLAVATFLHLTYLGGLWLLAAANGAH